MQSVVRTKKSKTQVSKEKSKEFGTHQPESSGFHMPWCFGLRHEEHLNYIFTAN